MGRAGVELRFIDLFCGIGGFRLAAEGAARARGIAPRCVFSSDIDPYCREAYAANFGEAPVGDITAVDAADVPDHDLLLGGFPCQAFSIIGHRRGLADTRGTLFFDIARVLDAKRPAGFVLENVKMLRGHNDGATLRRILETVADLGYVCEWRVLNALDFGLPQKRERIFLVGALAANGGLDRFEWPTGAGGPPPPLETILQPEAEVPDKFRASDHIRRNRLARVGAVPKGASVWHENKSGHVSAHPFACALRAGASHNYLLVNGERRLTPREMLRLQGFPDTHRIVCGDHQTRKQAGNSLPVPVAQAVIHQWLVGWANRQNK